MSERGGSEQCVISVVRDADVWDMPEQVGDCAICACYYGAGAEYVFWVAELDGLQKGRHGHRDGAAGCGAQERDDLFPVRPGLLHAARDPAVLRSLTRLVTVRPQRAAPAVPVLTSPELLGIGSRVQDQAGAVQVRLQELR